MTYTQHYDSPLGGILLAADEEGLTGLWFDGQKYFARTLPKEYAESETPVLCEAKRWLDIYFSGREPDFTPPLHPVGSAFQQAVWALLLGIPYGKTTTYGTLARKLAEKQGLTHMSAQAVGGAVGHNDISLIIPCHRVVGANGSLTGYAGGVDKKIKLLELERADMKSFFVPKKGDCAVKEKKRHSARSRGMPFIVLWFRGATESVSEHFHSRFCERRYDIHTNSSGQRRSCRCARGCGRQARKSPANSRF